MQGGNGRGEGLEEGNGAYVFLFTFSGPICLVWVAPCYFKIRPDSCGKKKKVLLVLTLFYYPNSFQDARKFKPEVSSGFGVSHWKPHGFGIGCL